MNIDEFVIRIIMICTLLIISAFYSYYIYNKKEKIMDLGKSGIRYATIINKKIEIKKVLNTNMYEFMYFIEVEDGFENIITINVSSDEYFKSVNNSSIKLEFYKDSLIGIKYEKRGKKL